MSTDFRYTGGRNNERLKDGNGLFEINDLSYKGSFSNGLCQGLGVLRKDKFRYRGDFRNGRFHGLGVLEVNEIKYEGEFLDGKIHGKGRVTFSDGTQGLPSYEGKFENGVFTSPEPCHKVILEAQENAGFAEAGCNNFNHEQF